jgi:hypothetical protein
MAAGWRSTRLIAEAGRLAAAPPAPGPEGAPAIRAVTFFTVAAWRETPYFSDAERAALALTEAVTRIADRPDPVPDEIWDEAARHYDEAQLGALVLLIAEITVWNRINAATRQITGDWVERLIPVPPAAGRAA